MRHQRRGITHRLHDGSHLFPTCLSLAHASLHFFGNHRERPEKDPKLEHPSLVTHRGLVIVRGSYLGSDGPQSLGMLLGQQPLSKPKIGATDHPDLAIRPGLLDDPVDGIHAIVGIVELWIELALGGKPSPAILKHHHISLLSGSERRAHKRREPARQVFVIGQAHEEHRMLSFLNWSIDISGQVHAVAHRDHHVFFNHNVHRCPPVLKEADPTFYVKFSEKI